MNRALFRAGEILEGLRPGREPEDFSKDSFLLRESAIRMYRKGERGHPYLRPLCAWKKEVG